MKLLMYGLSLDPDTLESNAFYQLDRENKQIILQAVKAQAGVDETYILQNNRLFELYLFVDEEQFNHGDLLRYLAEFGSYELTDIIYFSYSYYNDQVINHLFNRAYGTVTLNSSDFFKDFIRNAIIAKEIGAIDDLFHQLFNQLLGFMFSKSLTEQLNNNVILQMMDVLKTANPLPLERQEIVLLGATLDNYYLSLCLLGLGVKSVIVTDIHEEKTTVNCIDRLADLDFDNLKLFNDHDLILSTVSQPDYHFATADTIFNLVIGWSNLKELVKHKIDEVRLTPKRVTYASYYEQEDGSVFDEVKLSLPESNEEYRQSEEVQEIIQLAADQTYQMIFKEELEQLN